MGLQLTTVMAEEDEDAFLRFAYEAPSVVLITKTRTPTAEIPTTREVRPADGNNCMLWDRRLQPTPTLEFMPSCNDYILRSDGALVQFLRSRRTPTTISSGRIAIGPGRAGVRDPDVDGRLLEAWFRRLVRWLKSNFSNTCVYASDYKPDVGERYRDAWVGPAAIEASLRGIKLKLNGPPEYSLHHVDAAHEAVVMAQYRRFQRLLLIGIVAEVGEAFRTTGQRYFAIEYGEGAPFNTFAGTFRSSRPEPRVGDEVACVFAENI